MSAPSILLVSHEATLTGAPMNLLHLARWIVENTDSHVEVLILRDGPLRQRFEHVCPVHVADAGLFSRSLGIIESGLLHLGSSRAYRPFSFARYRPILGRLDDFDVVYLNSAASMVIAPFLGDNPVVISHVHELMVGLSSFRPARIAEWFRTRPDLWITASDAVSTVLIQRLGIPADAVRRHYESIDTEPFAAYVASPRRQVALRNRFAIPRDVPIVMGAGTIDWRKGPDLFVQLGAELARRSRDPLRLVWVGGDLDGLDMLRLQADMDAAKVENVLFVGTHEDPREWFAMADLFVLTSREDPFPLVCLEHAAMGHPIVTFRNGGMPELLDAAGPHAAMGAVDHLDIGAMANEVLALLSNDRRYEAAAGELRAEVIEHHDMACVGPGIYAEVLSAFDRARRSGAVGNPVANA